VTTALVTGASAGIGEAFARELAVRGHDLVLVARRADRLDDEAARLGAAHGLTVEPLVADLATPDGVGMVAARLADPSRPIDVLVNNAGVGSSGSFWELPVEHEVAMIHLNVVALVQLTHAALAPMVARNAGGVINVSSLGAYQPVPFNATYGATKAFVSSFSQAVHEELKGTGVKCMVLSPGFTRTEFQVRAGFDSNDVPGFLWQDAATVVQHALRAYDAGRAVCVPGPLNAATAAFAAVTPHAVTRRIAGVIVSRSEK